MKLLVLVISYALVYLIEYGYSQTPYSLYYFGLAISSFCIFGISISLAQKSALIYGYAATQFAMLCLYTFAIYPDNFPIFEEIMYDGVVSFSFIILMYEIIMLIFGFKDGYNAITRFINDRHVSGNPNQRSV